MLTLTYKLYDMVYGMDQFSVDAFLWSSIYRNEKFLISKKTQFVLFADGANFNYFTGNDPD